MTAPDQPPTGEPAPASQDAVAREQVARYLTIEELSAETRLSVSTLRRLTKKGLIVGYQPGGPRHRIVFPPDAIESAAKVATTPAAEVAAKPTRSGPTGRPQRGPQPKWFRQS